MERDPKSALAATLSKALEHRPDVRLAMLFGSRARGQEHAGSDADVAVDAAGVDLLGLAADLSLAASTEVDVTDLRRAGYPLLKAVLRDGIVLHEGEKGAAADWRSQAISRIELDRPWFELMRDAFLKRLAAQSHG